ncbi:MAG: trxB [Rhizobacter sp.]|nr:trxB [Rhizobacter sp.]
MSGEGSRQDGVVRCDALIVGAGPVGLFQVFQLGLLEVRAHVVDSLPYPGGQCVELYADKPIYDIPSVRRCTGRELVDNLLSQIEPFDAPFHLGQVVTEVHAREDGGFDVATSSGLRFDTRAVIVAGGVGSFQPRRIKVEGLDAFEGTQMLHRLPELASLAGRDVVIQGDTDMAVEAAVRLATWRLDLDLQERAATSRPDPSERTASLRLDPPNEHAQALDAATDRTGTRDSSSSASTDTAPRSVTLVHRRDVFAGDADLVSAMRSLCKQGALRLAIGQIESVEMSDACLTGLRLLRPDATTTTLPVDTLLVLLGLSPKLGPIADWGIAMERKQIIVDTATFETNVPGLLAIGDINTYPGKKKLIVSGFHEATLAAYTVAARVRPDRRVPLQYTTTSPRLHELLGVSKQPDA